MDFTLNHKTVNNIIKQYDTDGHRPYLILADDLESYVMKTPNSQLDKISLTKEIICSNLLKLWQVQTPDIVTLSINKELLDSKIVKNDKRLLISKYHFGSKYLPNSIDIQTFITSKGKVNFNRISNPESLLLIALFDIWIENDDRKPSNNNLLLTPNKKGLMISPIDHSLTFGSVNFEHLNSQYVSFSDNDSILYSSLGMEIVKKLKCDSVWFSKARKSFYICIRDTKSRFLELCRNLPAEYGFSQKDETRLQHFLFDEERNKKVFEHYSYIINHILTLK